MDVVAGASAIDLKRGLERGAKAAVDQLKALSRPVKERKEKAQVATISAHNDPLKLSNRPTGGLRASIALPLQSEAPIGVAS